ncbi:MAG: hypothetical protein H6874_08355 [Hyphomicrobiaceae bacterium]|nr:hypothetical protein [Hyphomicrobiaceae bacterium]
MIKQIEALALAGVLALSAASAATASNVVMANTDYNCAYVNEHMTEDQALRSFMIDYTFGFVTGMNIQMLRQGEPGFDFSLIDSPMLITWTAQVCNANPDMSYAEAVMRMFDVIRAQAAQGQGDGG